MMLASFSRSIVEADATKTTCFGSRSKLVKDFEF